jgi:hypothetical protein
MVTVVSPFELCVMISFSFCRHFLLHFLHFFDNFSLTSSINLSRFSQISELASSSVGSFALENFRRPFERMLACLSAFLEVFGPVSTSEAAVGLMIDELEEFAALLVNLKIIK